MKTREDILRAADDVRQLDQDAWTFDAVLRKISDEGFNFAASAEVIRFSYGISLSEAKRRLIDSPVWAQSRQKVDASWDAAVDALDDVETNPG